MCIKSFPISPAGSNQAANRSSKNRGATMTRQEDNLQNGRHTLVDDLLPVSPFYFLPSCSETYIFFLVVVRLSDEFVVVREKRRGEEL